MRTLKPSSQVTLEPAAHTGSTESTPSSLETIAGPVDSMGDTLHARLCAGAPAHEPAAPMARIGRHHVLGVLGRGGMGIVYDAYDPQLDRRVAIKILSRPADSKASVGQDRLLAEAQAMARVSHPNVIQVYDVDTHEGQVYVAMERLEGGTLGAWLAREEPGWRAIVKAFVGAGRGLLAAHETGLVHLDFKPDNVLLDHDGRPRVLDFGIARLFATPAANPDRELDELRADSAAGALCPSNSSMAGTPAYMAPEQFGGLATDARTDQFSFCVALYEALAGARPFAGDTLMEIAAAVTLDEARPLPASASAPRYVARVLRRGLSRDPQARYPSMEALLRELDRDPSRGRRRVTIGVALGLVAGLAGAAARWQAKTAAHCSGADIQLEGVWDHERAEQVVAALEATKLPYAPDTAARVRVSLDAYAQRWRALYQDNCEATVTRHEQSEAAMDLRLACLHQASQSLGATVNVLVDADEAVAALAQPMVDGLPDLGRCANLDVLTTQIPEPRQDQAERVDAIRALLANARAMGLAGRYERAFEIASQAERDASKIDYGPLDAEVALGLALVERSLHHHEQTEELCDRALGSALEWNQWELAREAALLAMVAVGASQAKTEIAMKYAAISAGLSERADTAAARAAHVSGLAAITRTTGDYDHAESLYRQVLAFHETASGLDSTPAALAHLNLAVNLKSQGHYDLAAQQLHRAIEILSSRYGPKHPKLVSARSTLAKVETLQGHYDDAEHELRWVLEQRLASSGGRGSELTRSYLALATLLVQTERFEDGEAMARAAIAAVDDSAIAEGLLATAYNNLGNALELQDDLTGAMEAQARALELHGERHGDAHPQVAITRSALGLILDKQGEFARAEHEQRAALTVLEATLGPDHPHTANVRSNLGLAIQHQGRVVEALAVQRSAYATSLDKLGADHPQTKEILEVLENLAATP